MPSLVLVLVAFVTSQISAVPPPPGPLDAGAQGHAVIASLTAGNYAAVEARFNEAVKAAMPAGALEKMWTALQAQAGALRQCRADARIRAIADKQMVITPCEFARATIDVQFAFQPDGRIAGITFRPAAVPYTLPAYATASAYTEQEVTAGTAEWSLPGTLTLPTGPGPFPAVVLVHGSGPNDRDETIGADKPFKDLAAGLASRGVAVLRYDKRSRVYGARMSALPGLTVKEEAIDDAIAGLAALRAEPRIDPARVYVLGHSLGGMLVPRIAAADPRLAGAIVMAGPARPIAQAILEQTTYLAKADGTVSAAEQTQIDEAAKLVASVAALTQEDAAKGVRLMNVPAAYWLDLRGYDPPVAAKDVRARMLILQGERDYQVTMEEFARWKAALADRRDVTFHTYPALNHLFIAGTGPSLPAEYDQPSHVAEEVVRDIAAWITSTPKAGV